MTLVLESIITFLNYMCSVLKIYKNTERHNERKKSTLVPLVNIIQYMLFVKLVVMVISLVDYLLHVTKYIVNIFPYHGIVGKNGKFTLF